MELIMKKKKGKVGGWGRRVLSLRPAWATEQVEGQCGHTAKKKDRELGVWLKGGPKFKP
jgi:hypothetical protein